MLFETSAGRPMRDSARKLRDLYSKINDRGRNPLYSSYPLMIEQSEPQDPHADGWFLLLDVPADMTERAMDSMLSIYGLIQYYKETGTGGFYVKFETDEQVDAIIEAGYRLNIRGNRLRCFRLREAP